MRRMKVIDAFCGAGGLGLGLKQADFEILFSFDIEQTCIDTLAANPKYLSHQFQNIGIKELINGGIYKYIKLNKGEVDVLAGGPPCQGFSVQRTIGGDSDERNLLIDDYAQLISELMPKFFLLENVVGITGKRGIETLNRFKAKMVELGYYCHQKVVDAQSFGVPQRRKRLIIVGEYNVSGKLDFEWPMENVLPKKTVRDTIAHLPPPPSDGSEYPSIKNHRADKLSKKNLERIMALKPGQAREDLPESLVADCHKLDADKIGHRNVYGRMEWDDVAPTITARFDSFTRGKFGHPEQHRSISLREGALLQTFPEDYEFIGNKVEVARQIGNAVPVKLAEILGKAIMKALEKKNV